MLNMTSPQSPVSSTMAPVAPATSSLREQEAAVVAIATSNRTLFDALISGVRAQQG